MFYIGDLFQWERFITPSIIKLFYWLVVIIVILRIELAPAQSRRTVGGRAANRAPGDFV